MSAATPLELTGERTVPGLPAENYWFRRHEAVYAAVPGLTSSPAAPPAALVLDAGSGEGYGVSLMAGAFPSAAVVGVDYDEAATRHAGRAYGRAHTAYVRGLLTRLPLADAVADVVVSLQVIEHIWNPDGYVRELARVCRPGGTVVLSTPNRVTFSPGLGRREQPSNIFHCREYDAAELEESVSRWAPALGTSRLVGLRHGPRLRRWEATHGSLVAAQLKAPGAQWPGVLERVVASAEAEDFELSGEAVDACLDLVVVLEKSG